MSFCGKAKNEEQILSNFSLKNPGKCTAIPKGFLLIKRPLFTRKKKKAKNYKWCWVCSHMPICVLKMGKCLCQGMLLLLIACIPKSLLDTFYYWKTAFLAVLWVLNPAGLFLNASVNIPLLECVKQSIEKQAGDFRRSEEEGKCRCLCCWLCRSGITTSAFTTRPARFQRGIFDEIKHLASSQANIF